jgi:hypothetical protein
MLIPVLTEVREMLGSRRRATIVFDRGGWSPKLFVNLLAMGFDILTYRKGCTHRIAEKRFILRKAKLEFSPLTKTDPSWLTKTDPVVAAGFLK